MAAQAWLSKVRFIFFYKIIGQNIGVTLSVDDTLTGLCAQSRLYELHTLNIL